MRSSPVPERSRTRGQRTATGPTPVTISRSGRWPWRTSRWRPSSVSLSAWQLSRAATSASTACASNARASLRKTSVSGSAKVPGWESWKTLVSVTAYHSFGGEVEASNTPTIRRLTPSCRHQLLRIARSARVRSRIMAVDDRYEQQLKIFEQLRERINKLLNRFGEPDSLVHLGDYSVHGDYWGYPQVKVSLGKLELLRPEIIDLLQKSLTGFPGWEIVVAVAVRGHYDD